MSKTLIGAPKVGSYVYGHFRPQRPGKIIAVRGQIEIVRPDKSIYVSSFYNVRVRWTDGTESDHSTSELTDFMTLIEDHKRKLKTHLTSLKKLEAL